MNARAHRVLQQGAGMVETMIGVLIGLIVVLVIYNLLSATEGYKRMANGASDAQVTGLLSQFILSREVGNGGNGISLSAAPFGLIPGLSQCAAGSLWRPIPLLVHDSGSNDISDSFITFYSSSSHVVWPTPLTGAGVLAAAAPITVQSPNGFTVPVPSAANPYHVILVNPATGDCELADVVAATAPPDPATGNVTLTQGASHQTTKAYSAGQSGLINLGPDGQAARMQFEARDPVAAGPCDNTLATQPLCQLYSRDLFAAAPTWNPLAQNVVLMKAQYGIDLSPTIDGGVDCWTPADNTTIAAQCVPGGVPTDYRDVTVPTLTLNGVQRIVALRVGIVVRDDEPDLKVAATDLSYAGVRANMYLFNCSANDDVTCQGRIHLSNNVIRNGWRYRTYETVIPLRNAIFNDSP